MCIILYLEPLPQSFVMVGGSQGLALQLHVGSGSVYLALMESRWASNASSLPYRLSESGPLIPAARQSRAEHLWMGEVKHTDGSQLRGKRCLKSLDGRAVNFLYRQKAMDVIPMWVKFTLK